LAVARKPKVQQDAVPEDLAAERFIRGADKPSTPQAVLDESTMKPTMIRMELDLRDRIDAAAKASGMGRSAWIRYQCIRALDEGR
jgi:hypothetical protein